MIPKLTPTESYVKGRSTATAKALIEAAGDRAAEVRTTSHGYVLPSELLGEGHGFDVYTAEDRPAVPTEPGTTTDPNEATHVRSTAPAEAEEPAREFDPSKATIDEVQDYLSNADDTERERVLAAEAEGKKRKGVLDLATTPEGAK